MTTKNADQLVLEAKLELANYKIVLIKRVIARIIKQGYVDSETKAFLREFLETL